MKRFIDLVSEYDELKKGLREIERKKAELFQMYCFPHCSGLSDRVQSQTIDYPSEKYAEKTRPLDEEQKTLSDMLEKLRQEISDKLSKITIYKAQDIIEDRIFLKLSWEKIANRMYYSVRRIRDLYWGGMKQVEAEEKRSEMAKD